MAFIEPQSYIDPLYIFEIGDNTSRHTLGSLMAVSLLASCITAITAIAAAISTIVQLAYGKAFYPSNFARTHLATERQAPIATSSGNLYIV
ncbi:MAG: hypothetical protein ACJ72X_02990 [Nitrososphaeraceae archaeon]